jgi:hypothetical protein
MNRARHVFAATLAVAACTGGLALAAMQDAPKAPELKSVLAGRKLTPPIRGQADVDYIRSPTKREGNVLVTKLQVKNASNAPIPRLTIDETWYDKNQNMIPGGKGVVEGLLQPGEVKTLEIRTTVNPNMSTSTLMFSHANGPVKPHAVKSMDAPGKEPAAKTAAKAPAAKKK